MRKTALELAIQKLKDRHNYYVDESLKTAYIEREKELLYVKSVALGEMISEFEGLLPTDKDNLRHAYNHSCTDKSFEEYYKENYDKQDTK